MAPLVLELDAVTKSRERECDATLSRCIVFLYELNDDEIA